MLLKKVFKWLSSWLYNNKKTLFFTTAAIVACMGVTLAIGKIYQHWDKDPDRGAIAIEGGAFGESYTTPIYLDQGWGKSDSLWYYNTTQGSALLPYEFYLNLEVADSSELLRSNKIVDKYRYLPQKPTFFNPDGLPVGFVKDTYQGKEYMGYTCAACHTSQVNYTQPKTGETTAIRIDGGPAMADMVGYLRAMQKSLEQTISDPDKNQRFVKAVLAYGKGYNNEKTIQDDLIKFKDQVRLYNTVNHSKVEYGYARLDAFGRIYNRVLQYTPNKEQVADILSQVTAPTGRYLLNDVQVENVMAGINDTIIDDQQFMQILDRLKQPQPDYPALSLTNLNRVRKAIFNEPNAPVSYPFLWDIAQSDYVQWNGVANNASVGPLGRNTGEVIGVFGKLDWSAEESEGFSISAYLTGQKHKNKIVDFKSSIDLVNLQRIEHHLASLTSPQWPEAVLGDIDKDKAKLGKKIYGQYCQSCHEVVERDNLDRKIIGKFSALEKIGTDEAMAMNAVSYKGKSGNFKHTYQSTDVGNVLIEEEAPVVQVLTSVTKGVVATPDPDKNLIRRWLDWLYTLVMSVQSNPIKEDSVKAGDYNPDTTANPYASLVAYKARSLNGIWATAPYLHNGSVPSLYDLLLPVRREGDPADGEYRPDSFMVGSREFDPVRVGFRISGYDGHEFKANKRGDFNTGHEYAAGKTAQMDGTVLPALTEQQRWQLIEFIKTL